MSEEIDPNDSRMKIFTYSRSPIMSSYLVVFAIGTHNSQFLLHSQYSSTDIIGRIQLANFYYNSYFYGPNKNTQM